SPRHAQAARKPRRLGGLPARAVACEQYTPDDNALAQRFFQQAIDLDPTFSGAYGGLAGAQSQAADFQGSFSSAEALARRAVALDGADAEARSRLSNELRMLGDCEGALAEAERALATTPNLASAHHVL